MAETPIAAYAAKQAAFQDRQDTAIDGLIGDFKGLSDLITALQNSAGTVTPEDQALLDQMESRAATFTSKLEALDQMTPPVVPPTA